MTETDKTPPGQLDDTPSQPTPQPTPNTPAKETRLAKRLATERKRRRFRRNGILTVLSNFTLALAVGSVGTGLAKIFGDLENIAGNQIYAVVAGLAFLALSVRLTAMKEPTDD